MPTPRRQILFRLLALSTGLLLLVLLEGVLRLLPWSPPTRQEALQARNLISIEHYYHHYDEFFVKWEQHDGVAICGPSPDRCRGTFSRANGMQWDRFPCQKPPGTFRIVTLGGSSTQGFGVDASQTFATRLEELLAGRTAQPVEVINAGIAGYNTIQIRRMLPYLRFLEPDLYVLYAGHNDYNYFLVADAAELTPPWVRHLRSMGDRLVSWRALRTLFQTIHPPPGLSSRPQEGWGRPGGARQRAPHLKDTVRPVPEQREQRRALTQQEISARDLIDSRFSDNVTALVAEARTLGAQVVLLSPVCRVRDAPVDSIHWRDLNDEALARWDGAWRRARDAHNHEAAASLEQALAIDDSYSHLRHLAGELARDAGRYQEARAHYLAAMDWNPPTSMDRAPPHHAQVVAQAARDLGVLYIDLWPVFAEAAELPGLPDDELFLDTIHPNPAGHRLIARTLADALLQQELVLQPGR